MSDALFSKVKDEDSTAKQICIMRGLPFDLSEVQYLYVFNKYVLHTGTRLSSNRNHY